MESFDTTVKALLDQGIESTRVGQYGKAGQQYLKAIEDIETWRDGPDRLQYLQFIGFICSRSGHPDLALIAMQKLLESKECSNNPKNYCTNLITLANSWNRLGRLAASYAVNKEVMTYALLHNDFSNAASASTNLAMLEANNGHLTEALKRLKKSLELLAMDSSNCDTDVNTRLALIQVVDALHDTDPSFALEASTDLFIRLKGNIGPERWEPVAPAFHRLVDRYLVAHPELDAQTWKQKTFPYIFGEEISK
ncbi:hypothetical protein SAMN04489760_1124 [Syntrophus gentianae]|uniref:Tetratricopeptide repeat-containing protein n=1 Tax=Syntrophus gentianae TaxID=43775 RepID=A0A1H7XSI7_9BACT|nr:hypothetical protein [Syntrophus gentianae]SEM36635.1 hypothetical protein SAMN04489760_1124 [Syntrophus gentianae]